MATPLTTSEVADLLKVKQDRVRDLIKNGHLKSFSLPSGTMKRQHKMVTPEALLQFAQANGLPEDIIKRIEAKTQETVS